MRVSSTKWCALVKNAHTRSVGASARSAVDDASRRSCRARSGLRESRERARRGVARLFSAAEQRGDGAVGGDRVVRDGRRARGDVRLRGTPSRGSARDTSARCGSRSRSARARRHRRGAPRAHGRSGSARRDPATFSAERLLQRRRGRGKVVVFEAPPAFEREPVRFGGAWRSAPVAGAPLARSRTSYGSSAGAA